MANPPFTGSVFQEEISKDLLALCKTKKTELLWGTLRKEGAPMALVSKLNN